MKRKQITMVGLSFLVCMAGFFASAGKAMPPHPNMLKNMAAGKFESPYYLTNLENLRAKGVNKAEPHFSPQANKLLQPKFSASFKILTLLVDFSDKTTSTSAYYFDTLMYANAPNTVTDYWAEVSYNTLNMTSSVHPSELGWIRAPETYSYYVNNQNGLGSYPQNAQKLVEDLVDLADPYIDFSQFDNDFDGYVDGLVVVHAGPGAELTGQNNDIWSHKWCISPRYRDGVYIYTYCINPEYWMSADDMTLGVYCHELGHVLGLPDLYDIDYSSSGIGDFSLMAYGSWNGPSCLGECPAHLDAWTKISLGFVNPTVPTYDQYDVSFANVENNPIVYKLWTNGTPTNEYFLVENRQKIGYDNNLPCAGLCIWHIDDSVQDNTDEWWPGLACGQHYKVALVQADNFWDLEHYENYGDDGDLYPGSIAKTTFSPSSSPNSNSYSGTGTSVAVVSINESSEIVTADVVVGCSQEILTKSELLPQKATLMGNSPNPFNPETKIRFEIVEQVPVELEIFSLTGQRVIKLVEETLTPGSYEVVWNGKDTYGKEVCSGIYLCKLNAKNTDCNHKMVKLR